MVRKVCANTNKVDSDAKNNAQGYVVFQEESAIEAALKLNNSIVENLQIRVDRATPTTDASRSVFIGNLPYSAEETSLRAHFVKGCALDNDDVENVRIVRDRETMQCKGFGYILFKNKDTVMTALSKMHESKYMRRPLRVTTCGKRTKGRRGAVQEPKPRGTVSVDATSALKRILSNEKSANKRKRGEKKKGPAAKHGAPGKTRRATVEAKVEKRVKKLKKRAEKGMGKSKIR